MIEYGRQTIEQDDIDAVVAALQSSHLTSGSRVDEFERAVSSYCGVESAVALSNGTVALYLACQALGLSEGGLLWTSPNSFVASANCAHYCRAEVDFVDIESETGNMDMQKLEQKLEKAAHAGRLPDIVIPVHFAGRSCDMQRLSELARMFRFRVIEDACHALGGRFHNEKVGSCRWSDATVFSFHPVKSVTTAEGGMVVSRSRGLVDRIRTLANSGVTVSAAHAPWYREMHEPGINARLSDLHAALGTNQMHKLDQFVCARKKIAEAYINHLSQSEVRLPKVDINVDSAWHLFVVHVGSCRDAVCSQLRRAGIAATVHYVPIHRHPWYQARGFQKGEFPVAERHFETSLSLPLFPALKPEQFDYTVSTLCQTLSNVA